MSIVGNAAPIRAKVSAVVPVHYATGRSIFVRSSVTSLGDPRIDSIEFVL